MNTINQIFNFQIPYNELNLDIDRILSGIGYENSESSGHVMPVMAEIISEIEKHVDVSAGFIIIEECKISDDDECIIFGGNKFNSGKVINNQLEGITSFTLFTATIGENFDKWSSELFSLDPVKGYLADLAGAELTEAVADWIENKINILIEEKGLKCTNRYSPGYCGWSVAEQKKLFALLPEKFCGITLTESSLMVPRKSVSGIIGAGVSIEKKEYQCSICDMENCFRRKVN